MRVAQRPLDPDAVRTANEKLWSQFKELKGRKLSMGPKDLSYRKYWMDAYLEALSELQSIPTDPSDLQSVPPEDSDLMCVPVGDPVIECTGPEPSEELITRVERGKFTITVDRNTMTIIIEGKQEYFGDGATEEVVENATKNINETWSGTTTIDGETFSVICDVTGQIRDETDPADPDANQMQVKKTSDPPHVHKSNDPAFEYLYGTQPGMIHSNEDDGGTLTIPHEFGHALGLNDEYEEGPRDSDGNRTLRRTGPPGGLMGYIDPGSAPTDDNYKSLITGEGLAPEP